MERVDAPFTPEQVLALLKWQANPEVHPYTCANEECPHIQVEHEGQVLTVPVPLTPTIDGLLCFKCGYRQTWANDHTTAPELSAAPQGLTQEQINTLARAALRIIDAREELDGMEAVSDVEASLQRLGRRNLIEARNLIGQVLGITAPEELPQDPNERIAELQNKYHKLSVKAMTLILRYAGHLSSCASDGWEDRPCDCGFKERMEAFEEATVWHKEES